MLITIISFQLSSISIEPWFDRNL